MKGYLFRESELEAVDSSNGLERLSETKEANHLKAILKLVDEIDMRDNISGNDIKLNQVKNLANNCFSENSFQLHHNHNQQKYFDLKFIDEGKKNRPPLKAA